MRHLVSFTHEMISVYKYSLLKGINCIYLQNKTGHISYQ